MSTSMPAPVPGQSRAMRSLAMGGIVAPIVFILGWTLGGSLQRGDYSAARHDISDLGALTADHPWVMLACEGLAGMLTILFAIGALRPALALHGKRASLGPWMLAASLMGLDNLSDVFFRLDCRAMDGCTDAMRAASTNGQIHMLVGLVTALITVAMPFVLAARLKRHEAWRVFARPTLFVGFALLVLLIAYIALDQQWGQGLVQRAMALVLSAWVIALARRVLRITPASAGTTG